MDVNYLLYLPPVSVSLEIEIQMQDSTFKGTLEAFLVRILPLLVYNTEGNVLIWRPRVEPYDARLPISIFLYSICWGF